MSRVKEKKIDTSDMSREEWLKLRQVSGIGASEVADIVGMGWGTPRKVWEKKMASEIDPFQPTKLKAGLMMEPAIARWWSEETGIPVKKDHYMRFHPRYDYLYCDLDYIAKNGKETIIVECKNIGEYSRNHIIKQEELADYLNLQCQMQMFITGYKCELAILIGGDTFVRWPVDYDEKIITPLLPTLYDFWHIYCGGRTPPPPLTEEEIKEAYPAEPSREVQATKEILDLLEEYKRLDGIAKNYGDKAQRAKERIMLFMEDAEYLMVDDTTLVSWAESEGKWRFDSTAFKKEHPDLGKQFMKQGKPERRFKVK